MLIHRKRDIACVKAPTRSKLLITVLAVVNPGAFLWAQSNFSTFMPAQTVSYNFSNVEIDRYVRVSTTAFTEIVDLVGGIEVLVPKAV